MRCLVRGCRCTSSSDPGRYPDGRKKRSFFNFPKDPYVAAKWLRFCDNHDVDITKFRFPTVCSLHFKPEDIKSGWKPWVRPGAIPTLDGPVTRDSKSVRKWKIKRVVSEESPNKDIDASTWGDEIPINTEDLEDEKSSPRLGIPMTLGEITDLIDSRLMKVCTGRSAWARFESSETNLTWCKVQLGHIPFATTVVKISKDTGHIEVEFRGFKVDVTEFIDRTQSGLSAIKPFFKVVTKFIDTVNELDNNL